MDKRDKHSTYSDLEDVDRSCVHAAIVIAVVFAALAFIVFPAGIFDVPFDQLRAGTVLRLIGAGIIGILAILMFIDILTVFIKR